MEDKRQEADQKRRRAFFLRQLYQWHWISSGICLIGMILFALTGITLNHASQIEAGPRIAMRESRLPPDLVAAFGSKPAVTKDKLPEGVSSWLQRELAVNTSDRETEWSAKEIYVALPRPGGDAWLSIDRQNGAVAYEVTDRGWIAYFNDLHKGRHTGIGWGWFIDVFAVAAMIFCLTGLLLLQLHAARRPATWPVVGAGFVIPFLLLVLLVHR